jgi:hypothetical protein
MGLEYSNLVLVVTCDSQANEYGEPTSCNEASYTAVLTGVLDLSTLNIMSSTHNQNIIEELMTETRMNEHYKALEEDNDN